VTLRVLSSSDKIEFVRPVFARDSPWPAPPAERRNHATDWK
jgi:hypothetical protein